MKCLKISKKMENVFLIHPLNLGHPVESFTSFMNRKHDLYNLHLNFLRTNLIGGFSTALSIINHREEFIQSMRRRKSLFFLSLLTIIDCVSSFFSKANFLLETQAGECHAFTLLLKQRLDFLNWTTTNLYRVSEEGGKKVFLFESNFQLTDF